MTGLSGESIKFMAELWQNNNKSWFDANRGRYDEHVRLPLKALAEDLAAPVASILPEFTGKAKVSRINNDIRFSPNKPIYKQHMWVSFGGMMPCEADFFVGLSGGGWGGGAGVKVAQMASNTAFGAYCAVFDSTKNKHEIRTKQ